MERKANRSAVVVLVLAGLIVGYPLSTGPVWFLVFCFDLGPYEQTVWDAVELLYAPLRLLPEPVVNRIAHWTNWWQMHSPGVVPD